MASPQVVSVDWGDVVTTTLENRRGKASDNLTNNNALFAYLKAGGRIEPVPFGGGREIYEELAYAENQTFMWYSGTEYLNIGLNDTMTAARYTIKQCSIAVVLSGLESLMNADEQQVINLIKRRVETAESTWENHMSAAVYSDGTGYGGKQIGGLALLISKVPTTGIVGGIDRAANPFWRNYAINSNTAAAGVVSSSNIIAYMNQAAIALKRNSDGVDLIVADNNYYQYYLNALQAEQRLVTEGDGKDIGAGFMSLAYYGAGKKCRVILDGGKNGQISSNTMYFINTDYLWYRPHRDRDFKVVGGERNNMNQDAITKLMLWAGNITMGNASLQGVLWN